MKALLLLLVSAALILSTHGCGPSVPEKPVPPPKDFEVVQSVSAAIKLASQAQLEQAAAQGRTLIWQSRLTSNLEYLDEVAAALAAQGGYGPPRHEQADELQRICYELQQTAECDPKLVQALRPSLLELQRVSKKLRTFTEPG